MKIKHIHITGFGQFVNADFDVADGWQVFAGHNEAGKSTLRAFIKGVLFGYPAGRGAGNTYEPKVKNQPYGGWLEVSIADKNYRITRMNRTSSQIEVLDIDQQIVLPTPEAWLQEQLLPLHKPDFEAIYDFNQADLQAITQMSGEDVQRLLLNIGAPGAQDWLDVKNDLTKQADQQFAQRATKKPINQAIQAWQAQVDEQAVVTESLTTTRALEAQLDEAQEQLQAANAVWRQAQQHLDQQQALQQAYQLYQERVALQQHLQEHPAQHQVPVTRSQVDALVLEQREIAQLQDKLANLSEVTEPSEPQPIPQLNHWAQRQQALQAQFTYDLKPQADSLVERERQQTALHQQYGWDNQATMRQALEGQRRPRWQGLLLVFSGLVGLLLGYWFALPMIIIFVLGLLIGGGIYLLVSKQPISEDIRAAVQREQALAAEITEQRLQLTQQVERMQRELVVANEELALGLQLEDIWQDGPRILAAIDELVQDQHAAEELYHQQRQTFQAQQTQRAELATSLQKKQTALQEQLRALAVHDLATLQEHYDQQRQWANLQQRLTDLDKQIPEALQDQLANMTDVTEINQHVHEAKGQRDAAQQQILAQQQVMAHIQAQLDQRVNDDTVLQLTQRIADQENAISEALQHYLSQKLAAQVIDRALTLGTQERFPKMQTLAQKILAQLTQHRYATIIFDHNTLQVQREDGQRFSVTELSTGTQEQIYVALRLALVQVMHDQIQLPLLIDDGFVHFDPQRRAAVLAILAEIATDQQVIYWTAETNFAHTGATVTRLGES